MPQEVTCVFLNRNDRNLLYEPPAPTLTSSLALAYSFVHYMNTK